ncbi:hypothetical protein AB0M22_09335 [Nocardia sp. NPDC051756]|uniref:hypothetical protein n=1 Tax=Nocardia sp. NPDC051756 TaxID=3154751 RepID=UPI003431B77E
MTKPIREDEPWRRTWRDGDSVLTVTHDYGGRVFIAVDDVKKDGFAASFGRTAGEEIAAFIREGF